MKHTPVPWKVGNTNNGVFVSAEAEPGYFLEMRPCSRHHIDRQLVNAKHLVHCVNNHDAMLEALKDILVIIDTGGDARDYRNQIAAALRQAGEI